MKWIVAALVIWLAWHFIGRAKAAVLTDEMKARAVLGVGEKADAEKIRAAHRRAIADAHPDRGGSAELANRLNAARDLLLRGRG